MTIVHQSKSWIRVLNTNECERKIPTKNLIVKPFDDFDVFKPTIANENERSQRCIDLGKILKIPLHAREMLLPLCLEYSDIFYLENDKLSVNNFYQQNLKVIDDEPVFTKNYRLPHTQRAEIRDQVHKLLADDLIEMSTSSYNSPLIIVPKKSLNGKPQYRMCVDYRRLNKKLNPDKFTLPRIEEILEGLGRARYFSIMDLQSGYHQILLNENSRHFTAISTDSGFYQWKVLPFGKILPRVHFQE